MTEASVGKLCGRPLSAADLETIRRAIDAAAPCVPKWRGGCAAPWGGMTRLAARS